MDYRKALVELRIQGAPVVDAIALLERMAHGRGKTRGTTTARPAQKRHVAGI